VIASDAKIIDTPNDPIRDAHEVLVLGIVCDGLIDVSYISRHILKFDNAHFGLR
jgi:hypothetical protein